MHAWSFNPKILKETQTHNLAKEKLIYECCKTFSKIHMQDLTPSNVSWRLSICDFWNWKIRYVRGYGGQNIPTSSFASSEKAEGIWKIWISSELWRVTNRSILFWSSSTSWKGKGHHLRSMCYSSHAWGHLFRFMWFQAQGVISPN